VVTGNLTTPHIISWDNLSKGAIFVEYPAGKTAGGFLDMWQRPITDLGLTGPDQGKGGQYIIVGPDDDPAKYKKDGLHVFQSATNNVFIGLRLLEPAPGFKEQFKKALRISAVGGEPAQIKFLEGLDREWSGTAPRGLDYWKRLGEIVDEEPVREQDKVWMAMLAPLGIQKGNPSIPMRGRPRF